MSEETVIRLESARLIAGLARAGWQTRYVPTARVRHESGAATTQAWPTPGAGSQVREAGWQIRPGAQPGMVGVQAVPWMAGSRQVAAESRTSAAAGWRCTRAPGGRARRPSGGNRRRDRTQD